MGRFMLRIYQILLLAVLLTVIGLPAHSALATKKIIRIAYGIHAEQIGVIWASHKGEGESPYNIGPFILRVDTRSDIYLGDEVHGLVKRFSPKGSLLTVTERGIGSLQSYWVSPTGDVYARTSDRISEVVRFDAVGHRLWAKTFREMMPPEELNRLQTEYGVTFPYGFRTVFTEGPQGTVMLGATGQLPDGRNGQTIGVMFDDKGNFVGSLPYFGVKVDDVWWVYHIDGEKKGEGVFPPCSLEVYAEDGVKLRTVAFDPGTDKSRYAHMITDSMIKAFPDRKNGTFFVTLAQREPKATSIADYDFVMDRYGSDGKFIERYRFPSGPFNNGENNYTVAPDGTLYFLQYDEKGFDVMVYVQAEKETDVD